MLAGTGAVFVGTGAEVLGAGDGLLCDESTGFEPAAQVVDVDEVAPPWIDAIREPDDEGAGLVAAEGTNPVLTLVAGTRWTEGAVC